MARVHFVGVGGYSMSGLAEVLHAQGHEVSGCDARASSRTRRVADRGISVWTGHDPAHLEGVEEVVYSTDVPWDNPELAAARARGLVLRHRSEVLADVLHQGRGIAVTGTHGKTTTTAMIGWILLQAGRDPTVLLGGEADYLGGGVRLGRGPEVVAEADESDGSFLRYRPWAAVLTNVQPEHLEHYGGSFGRVVEAYRRFAGQVEPAGVRVLCADDPVLADMSRASWEKGRTVTYGLEGDAQWRAADLRREEGGGYAFTAVREGEPVVEVRLRVPGRHSASNALAALAVAAEVGVESSVAAAALGTFANVRRRFEVKGRVAGALVVDDYAHHPTEIRAVLRAARDLAPRRVLAVFQPQRYTRTLALRDEFAQAFGDADVAVILDVYAPAGEVPIPGVSGEDLAMRINAVDPGKAVYADSHAGAVRLVAERLAEGDVVVTMGAGDVYRVADALCRGAEAAVQGRGDA